MAALYRVGLTGGVGSGKSTIAAMLAMRGAGVVDADQVARDLTVAGGAAIGPLQREFGLDAITAEGALNRSWMRQRTFADEGIRRRLEAILHPLIRVQMAEHEAALAARGAPYSVFVIPLLIESGHARDRVDRLLVIDCSVEEQLRRVSARPGIDSDLAHRIVAAQASRAERLAVADEVLFNEGPLPEVESSVDRLHRRYLSFTQSAPAGAKRASL